MTDVGLRPLLICTRIEGDLRVGHNHFPTIPNTIGWRAVIEALRNGASVDDIAAMTAANIKRSLEDAPNHPIYNEAVRLLVRIPLAARSSSFAAALGDLGLPVSENPDLTDIVFAIGDRLDVVASQHRRRNDLDELTRRALTTAVSATVGQQLPGLLEANAGDVQDAFKRLSDPREFTRLARAFYTKLISETFSSFLDRTLAAQIGPAGRFANVGDRSRFDDALRTYTNESTRIIHEFAAGWYGKRAFSDVRLTDEMVAGFGAVALKKILAEIRRRELDHV